MVKKSTMPSSLCMRRKDKLVDLVAQLDRQREKPAISLICFRHCQALVVANSRLDAGIRFGGSSVATGRDIIAARQQPTLLLRTSPGWYTVTAKFVFGAVSARSSKHMIIFTMLFTESGLPCPPAPLV